MIQFNRYDVAGVIGEDKSMSSSMACNKQLHYVSNLSR